MRFSTSAFLALSLVPLVQMSALAIDAKEKGKDKANDGESVAITVYNQNFGLVKDIRKVELKEGINNLRFDDVAAAIDPTSVSFLSLTAPNSVVVREQNYQYDLMDVSTILSKSVGKEIKIRQYSGGGMHEVSGTLLNSPLVTVSDSNGNISQRSQAIVLKTPSGIVLGANGEVELAELPSGLVAKPSLLWKLQADKGGEHRAEISYQTQGMNWKCDYVAVANNDDTACDLTSWVTLDNKSGASFKQASLKLMAGDVHRVTQNAMPRGFALMKSAMAGAAAPQFSEQSFAEYHLYSLAGRTDLNNNETKQLTLFNAASVPVKKLFVFESGSVNHYRQANGQGQKVNVKLEIANTQGNNLGMPMPKGKVRVYKKDQDGAMQFVGEDLIDHTPKDEKVRLYIGDAFDIVGERKQTNYQQISQRLLKQSFEISLRNHKEKEVTVTVIEHAYGDWKVVNSSQPFTKKDSHTIEFAVKVPANGESKVTYDLEIKH
ncbi:MAG: DUF4139 domain-containing protein [Candidatus Melainabacteria bacterium]|mgnify:CR=1 FL=1|uniref:DUF4139 domain-containing protein n=1 Tax=Candidatus Obscuribacter phosphatis TaxID=1906157 RepID=A0A8J7P777_9BACT|nr:DUF4139 domain-containing protein [Candidatus Obscuribacter phosphatis]MCA0312318.1 DUF4139 domain-containing protein [Candidatus Melainabacteria bacterium]